jgi:predicted RNase H-like nuclease
VGYHAPLGYAAQHRHRVTAILAIDPAWTPEAPSGVALVHGTRREWRCRGLAPSYSEFVSLANGTPVDWTTRPTGGLPDVEELVRAAQRLSGTVSVDLVTIDMPLSMSPIHARRTADSEISRLFGGRGCSAHSPSAVRPGPISDLLREEFGRLGYPLATTAIPAGATPALIEVYPHPALLALLGATYRVPYKVSRAGKYWPGRPPKVRRRNLVENWVKIQAAIALSISDANLPLPSPDAVDQLSTSGLKRYEDALDALICGWVGVRYLLGRCSPYGDHTAAIWVPQAGDEWAPVMAV